MVGVEMLQHLSTLSGHELFKGMAGSSLELNVNILAQANVELQHFRLKILNLNGTNTMFMAMLVGASLQSHQRERNRLPIDCPI